MLERGGCCWDFQLLYKGFSARLAGQPGAGTKQDKHSKLPVICGLGPHALLWFPWPSMMEGK